MKHIFAQLVVVVGFAISGALNQLAKNMACEWAKDNIRANAVVPWIIRGSGLDAFHSIATSRQVSLISALA